MPVIITTIISLISGLFGPIADWARRKQEMQAARERAEDAIRLQTMRNEGEDGVMANKRGIELLKSFSSWFRYIMIGMWFYPWVMVQFSSAQALKIFGNMNLLPAFYSESCVLIMFAVVGIPVGTKMVGTVFSSVTEYFQHKRETKYVHEQEVARINRKAMMDVARAKLFPKGMNQAQVDIFDEIADAGEKTS